MKTKSTNRFLGLLRRFFGASAIVMSFFGVATAQNIWTGVEDSDWNTTSANWTSPEIWANGAAASIPDGSGAITVTEDITATGLTIPGASDTITISAGTTLSIEVGTVGTQSIPTTGGWTTRMRGPGTLRLDSSAAWASSNWGPNTNAASILNSGFTGTLFINRGRTDAPPAGLGGATKIKVGAGGQFLAWTGTYTQAWELEGDGAGEAGQPGSFRVAGGHQGTFTGPVTLVGNTIFNSQDGNSQMIVNGVISGDFNITKSSNGGLLAFGAANTFSGTMDVQGGTLRLDNALALQNSTLTGSVGTVTFNSTAGTAFTLGGLAGTRNLTLQNSAAAAVTLSVGNNNADTSYGGILSGPGGLTKIGNGTLTLTGANTYAGLTTVDAGTLAIDSATARTLNGVSGSGTLVKLGTGSLALAGTSYTGFNGDFGVLGGTLVTTGYHEFGPGANLIFDDLTTFAPGVLDDSKVALSLNSIASPDAGSTVIDLTATAITLSSTPTPSNKVLLPLAVFSEASLGGGGLAALSLTLPRNYTGTLVDADQILGVELNGFTPTAWTGAESNVWDVNTSENWLLGATPEVFQNGDVTVFNDSASGAGEVTVSLPGTVQPAQLTFANATRAYSLTGAGAIGGGASVIKSGAAAVTLGGNNTFTGVVAVNNGVLRVAHANALGTISAGTTVADGATLDLNGTALAAEPLTVTGAGVANGGALVNSSGTPASTAAPITLGTATSLGGTGTMTLSGAITGTTGLAKTGTGTVNLSTQKTYTGDTTVSQGVLALTGGGGIGGTIRGGVTIGSGATLRFGAGDVTGYGTGADTITAITLNGGTLDVATTVNQTLGNATVTMTGASITGVGGANLDFFTNAPTLTTLASATPSVVSGVKLNLRRNNGVTFDIADGAAPIDFDVQSSISWSAGFTDNNLVKAGPGTMRIAAGTYGGATIIQGGNLIAPAVQSSPAYTLADDTTLTVAGAAGSSFATGSLTLGTGGATNLSIANFGGQTLAANAPVRVTSALTLNGPATLNVGGIFPAPGTYPLVSYPAGGPSGPGSFVLGTLPRSIAASLVPNLPGNTLDLVITGNTPVIWTGAANGTWDTTQANWNLGGSATAYAAGDIVQLDDSATGTTTITIPTPVAPAAVTVNNSLKTYSISGVITGATSLVKSGSGQLTLAGTQSYGGGTTILAGTLRLGDGATDGTVVGNITNHGALLLNNQSAASMSGLISGTGTLAKAGAGLFALSTTPTHSGATLVTEGTLRLPNLGLAVPVATQAGGTLEFERLTNAELDVSGPIAGTGAVSYRGPATPTSDVGRATANDISTYSGGTVITNARVNATLNPGGLTTSTTATTPFGSGPILVNDFGTLWVNGAAMVVSNPVTLNGFGWLEGGGRFGAVRLQSGAHLAGNITLGSDSRITAWGGQGQLSGSIGGTGNLSVAAGATTDVLLFTGTSPNTYSGTTTVSGGQLGLSKTGGAVAIPGNLVIENGSSPIVWTAVSNQFTGSHLLTFTGTTGTGRLNLYGTTQTFRGMVANVGSGIGQIQNSWNTPNNMPFVYANSTLVVNTPEGEDYSLLGPGIVNGQHGLLGLTKNGAGRQTVGNTNLLDFGGPTIVNGGELRFLNVDDSQSREMVVNAGAVFRIENVSTSSWPNYNGCINNGSRWSGSGTVIKSGTGGMDFTNQNADTIVAFGSGALVDVQEGVLRMRSGTSTFSRLNTAPNKADLNVGASGTFNTWYQGLSQFDALTGSGLVTRGDSSITTPTAGTLILGVDNGSGTFSGQITDRLASAISALGVTKRGSGTQVLNGVNTYAGPTLIEGGTLALGTLGDLTDSSVTILPGAQFDVSAMSAPFRLGSGRSLTGGRTDTPAGDVLGAVEIAGTLIPGGNGSAATLTLAGNTKLDAANLRLDLSPSAAAGNDRIAVTGNLTLTGITTVTPAFLGGVPDTNPYTFLTYTGTLLTGDATNFASGLPADTRYSASFDTSTAGQVKMTISGTGKNLTWSGATGNTWNTATDPLLWSADAEYFQNLDRVTFDDSADDAGAVTVNLVSSVQPGAMTVNNPTRDYTISGTDGVIAGGGALTKRGAAGLTLSNANTFTGGMTVVGGTVTLTHATAAGTGPITLGHPDTAGDIVLKANLGSASFANPITVSANGTGTVTIDQDSALSALTGTLTLNRPTTIEGGPDRTAVAGKITGNVGTLTFTGGRTTLDNTVQSNFTGNIEIAGEAVVQTNSMPDCLPPTASVNISGTGRLQLNGGFPQTINALTGGTTGTTGVQIIAGAATTLTVGAANGSGAFDGNIINNAAALSLVKTGAGTQALGGVNSYTGTTRILGGTLAVTNADGLAGSSLVYDNEGGTVDFGTLATIRLGGLRGTQDLPIPAETTSLVIGHGSNGESNTHTGAITMTAAGATFTKQGIGNLTLGGSNPNSWTGDTFIISNGSNGTSQGSLYLAKTGGAVAIPGNTTVRLGTGTNTGQANIRNVYDNQFGPNVLLNFGNTTSGYCRFDLMGTTQTLAGVTGGVLNTEAGGVLQNTGLERNVSQGPGKPGTLVLNVTGTNEYLFNGIIRDTDEGARDLQRLNLVKNGTGTQTLSFGNAGGGNGHNMTGSTTVNEGRLVIHKSNTTNDYYGSTFYTVAAGAVLELSNTAAAGTGARLANRNSEITGGGTIRKTGTGTTWTANGSGNTQTFLNMDATGLVEVKAGQFRALSTRPGNKADIQIDPGATLNIHGGGNSATVSYFDALNGGDAATNAILDIDGTRSLALGANGGGGTFSGNVTGAGSLIKQGAATLTLTGALAADIPTVASSLSGNITVNGGKLVGAAASSGTNSVFGSRTNTRIITVNSGATLEFAAPNTFGGHSTTSVPTLVVNGGTATNADPLATNRINNGLRNVELNNGTLHAAVGNGVSLIDEVNRPGEGYGAWGLNGTVTSTGDSTISSAVGGMGGRVLLGSHGADTIMNVASGTLTVSAPLQEGESGTPGGLTKTGPGRLVLSGANVHSTPTTVSAGTLELSGTMAKPSPSRPASAITVAAGATLMGTGAAEGTLAANGTVAPGASIGTLAVGTTTFGATGSLAAEINSATLAADTLQVNGDLTIDAAATLAVTDLGAGTPANAKLVLIRYTGVWNSVPFAGTADDGTITVGSNVWTINYNDTDGGMNAVTLRRGANVDPYDDWATLKGLTGADAAKSADPDGDGYNNLLEFATASEPKDGSSGPRVYPLMHAIGGQNALTYTMAVRTGAVFAPAANPNGTKQTATKDMVVYTVEASDDLSVWNVVEVSEVSGTDATAVRAALGAKLTTPPLDGAWTWRTFRTVGGAAADPEDFIRLNVAEETP